MIDDPSIRPATLEDALDVAPRLREKDRQEAELQTGLHAITGAVFSVVSPGPTYAILDSSKTVQGLFGVSSGGDGIGRPWLVGTDAMSDERYALRIGITARRVQQSFERRYKLLQNHTWVENTLHHQWLKSLGYEFLPAQPFGPYGAPFYQFYKLVT